MSSNPSLLIGQILRQLRRQRGLTGEQLARQAGFSQSKISKLETGWYSEPSIVDVLAILDTLGAEAADRRKIQHLAAGYQQRALSTAPYHMGLQMDPGYLRQVAEFESKANKIEIYTLHRVPALLQTVAYRLEGLKRVGVPDSEVGSHLEHLEKRQAEIWRMGHNYHFVIHHSMIYTAPPGRGIMGPQLDRLERMADLPNIRLGIIPLQAGLAWPETGPFALHDRKHLTIAMAGNDVFSNDPEQLGLYGRIFDELAALAVYGEAAKELLRSAPYA